MASIKVLDDFLFSKIVAEAFNMIPLLLAHHASSKVILLGVQIGNLIKILHEVDVPKVVGGSVSWIKVDGYLTMVTIKYNTYNRYYWGWFIPMVADKYFN